jgi:hypothetical protein
MSYRDLLSPAAEAEAAPDFPASLPPKFAGIQNACVKSVIHASYAYI